MIKLFCKIFLLIIFFNLIVIKQVFPEPLKKIEIIGNERIPNETIEMFTSVSINDDIDNDKINNILKELYGSGFFSNVNVNFDNNVLKILVVENPIIENIFFDGVKAKKIKEPITKDLRLRNRSSYNLVDLNHDKEKILSTLKDLGYYFSKVDVFVDDLDNNKVNIQYKIDLGDKAKIRKITFIGDKVFKDRKLRSVILSEEYKFWKFISGKKFLNEDLINFDNRLLTNFFLNKGYFQVKVNTSFAKIINENEFELIYNINAGPKIFFDELKLNLPIDYEKSNFLKLEKLLSKLKNKPYSINSIEKILEEIDILALDEQYESVDVNVIENINDNKLNLTFDIIETERFFVERINIFGNNVTQETVIRNQFELDEGDPYNEILKNKSINNIKNLNFFKDIDSIVRDGSGFNQKIIDINVEEKPTGEITASAGVGTSGKSIGFGVTENNFLGRGIGLNSNVSFSTETIKGLFSVTNPNFLNSDKSVYASLEASETDKLKDYGYKTNKNGFTFGTNFEYLDDFRLGMGSSNYYEKIETDTSASSNMKKQEGNYWDSFLNLKFDYDKRNQKFQTSDGFRSTYYLNVPLISETNTLKNTYDYKYYTELYEENITTFSIYLSAANSLTNDNVKLSERINVPSSKLRGFEYGKIGPKDGADFVGGNYLSALNISSTLPTFLENAQNTDFLIFLDAANLWGVDYDSSIDDSNKIRSSYGVGVDWFTPIGPLSFSLSQTLSKASTDEAETFRFDLGTTF
ncbi:MAG: outer membrane protein assembly factor BamA [Pelagibacterales bacterium MED-G42]|nr:MAG: outer membrane protein assembly factor BamA [Pelagibacterales bacterium MED-G42]